MIRVERISKHFGDVQALNAVSFEALDGRITGLLGQNGAGKSTTMRILSTLLRADAGTATVNGIDVAQDPLGLRRQIGVLPHDSGLYANLSARENIAYFAALQGMQRDHIKERVAQLIDMLSLEDIADRRAKGFSQGQRIRVGLARCMVHDPSTLILDEPTNGLDVMATRALRDLIRARRDGGTCVLFSSHIMQEVAALCDDIVIIDQGTVAMRGTVDEIRTATGSDDLEDAFVAAIGASA